MTVLDGLPTIPPDAPVLIAGPTASGKSALALKIARSYTGRSRIVKLEGVYHGSNDFAEISNYSTPENWGNPPASVPIARIDTRLPRSATRVAVSTAASSSPSPALSTRMSP